MEKSWCCRSRADTRKDRKKPVLCRLRTEGLAKAILGEIIQKCVRMMIIITMNENFYITIPNSLSFYLKVIYDMF